MSAPMRARPEPLLSVQNDSPQTGLSPDFIALDKAPSEECYF